MPVDTATRLGRLLRPRHIVYIAPPAPVPHENAETAPQLRDLRSLGYAGRIWSVVMPVTGTAGSELTRALAKLPQVPDAGYVALDGHAAVDAVRALAVSGVAAALCPATDFAEVGEIGVSLEQMLARAADGMPVVGAGSCGVINYLDGVVLWPEALRVRRLESQRRGVALIVHSNALARNLHRQRRGLPLACLVSLGDRSVVGSAAMLSAVLADDRVSAIGIQIDDILDVSALERTMSLAHERQVPVVAMRLEPTSGDLPADQAAGRSPGRERILSALLEHLGIAEVRSATALLETLKLLHVHGALPSRRVCFVSACCEDARSFHHAAIRAGLQMPVFDRTPHARFEQALGSFDRRVAGDGRRAVSTIDLERLFVQAGAAWGQTDSALLILLLSQDGDRANSLEGVPDCAVAQADVRARLLESFVALGRRRGCPTAVVADLFEGMPESAGTRLMQLGVAPLIDIETACVAVSTAAAAASSHLPEPLARAVATTSGASQDARRVYESFGHDEASIKSQLSSYGVGVPPGMICDDAQAAIVALEQLGAPVSLKPVGLSPGVGELSGWFGVSDKTEVRSAFEELTRQGAQVLVESAFADPLVSLRMALLQDPLVGLYMVIGAAGQPFTEESRIVLLGASAQRLQQVVVSLNALRLPACMPAAMSPHMPPPRRSGGNDSNPYAPRDGVVNAVVQSALALQRYALEHLDRIECLEIDPLVVLPKDLAAYAINVRVWLSQERRRTRPPAPA